MDKLNLDSDGISNLMNKKSGLLGISGVSSDMREVTAAANEGNPRAKLALAMYAYRIRKYIGAFAAAMNGVDIILFTGGVGENHVKCRQWVCEGLGYLGVQLDTEKNATIQGVEATISVPESKVKVVVIPTDEELMIATDTFNLVK